jgi:DegV family protein with EDD domain
MTDSTCDLSEATIAKHGIAVIPLYINVGEQSYLDGIELSRQEFYKRLPRFETHPTTSAPGPGMFTRVYERLAAEGASEILSLHIASTLSNVMNVAQIAARSEPPVPVTVFDAGQITLGTGLAALTAARAAAAGRNIAEIIVLLEDQRKRTHSFAALDTLEFLRRSGRLTRLQSSLGSILSVKPILTMHDGELTMERVRTRRRAAERLIEMVHALGPLEELVVVHTGAPGRAEAIHRQAQHLFPAGGDPMFAEVTPVIGAHVGPGAVGLVAVTARTA